MAPRKRKSQGADEAPKPAATTRVTRSSARLSNLSPAAKHPALPKRKRGKVAAEKKEEAKAEEKDAEEENTADDGNKRTIVIEHCKQCNSFKTRAIQVKNGLENAVPAVTVLLNPDKPRKGCFEIREDGGETFISLLDMKRPFKPMKDLDMDEVIADIIGKIK